ncbi:nebulette isoform X5 [Sphaerodactylus townsendi]|nr:nebulette isoform X5 [Sphaerodactylus townsendi]
MLWTYTAVPDTPETERIKSAQRNISTVMYKKGLGAGTAVKETLETERVKKNQKNISTVYYKGQLGKATSLSVTPEIERVKKNQEIISSVKYSSDQQKMRGRPSVILDTPELRHVKETQNNISMIKYHEDFEKTKGRGFTSVVDDPVTERVRRNTQVVSDAAYKGVHPHIVEMDRRPGIIVAPVLPGAYQQSQPQGYGYMHQTSVSSMRSMHSQPHSASLRTYRAMYDYSAQDEDEVSFRDGDYIINVQPIDDGWMYGTVQRTGKTGMLPANYIEFVN